MRETVKVVIGVQARITAGVEVEMSKEEFEEWEYKLDSTRGWEQETIAEQLISKAKIDWMDGDLDNVEVEQFDVVVD